MNKELIINAVPQGVEIALLEDRKLVELHTEKSDARFAVGAGSLPANFAVEIDAVFEIA